MPDGETKKLTFTLNQVIAGVLIFLAVVWGGKLLVRGAVKYVRGQIRAEVISIVTDLSGGKIDLNKLDGGKEKKLLPFASGDGIEE